MKRDTFRALAAYLAPIVLCLAWSLLLAPVFNR